MFDRVWPALDLCQAGEQVPAMRGQKEDAMRYEKFLGAILLVAAGCAQDVSETTREAAETGPPETLCVVAAADDGEPEVVALKSPACGGQCGSGEGVRYFSVEKGAPVSFALYGVVGIQYCVEVIRDYGYITISHERGTVTRKGDLFTWCITPTSEDPEFTTVRSFTASAGFELAVP